MLAGIGNAYSDEILHVARLSPFKIAAKLTDDELARLHEAIGQVLDRRRRPLGRAEGSDAEVREAQRPAGACPRRAAVPGLRRHGAARSPSPTGHFEYCPTCQTEGRELADRRLSKLLK